MSSPDFNHMLIANALGDKQKLDLTETDPRLYSGEWYQQEGNTCFAHSIVNTALVLGNTPDYMLLKRLLDTSVERGIKPEDIMTQLVFSDIGDLKLQFKADQISQEVVKAMGDEKYRLVVPVDRKKLYPHMEIIDESYHFISIVTFLNGEKPKVQIIDANFGSMVIDLQLLIESAYPFYIIVN